MQSATSLVLIVVSVNQTAVRCRVLETSEPITLRATGRDTAGRLASLGTTQGIALTYAFDSALLTGTTWSGTTRQRS